LCLPHVTAGNLEEIALTTVDDKMLPERPPQAPPSASLAALPYRHRSREHLDKAREFLARGDDYSVIAGCLFLRMSIEALAYDLLLAYRAEAPFDAMRVWQPKRVLDELLTIDDTVDEGSSIALADSNGVVFLSGTETRFEARWAASAHNALGNFLHEPTIKQVEEDRISSSEKMRAKAVRIAETIDAVLASPIFNVNQGQFVEIRCLCGFDVKRKMSSLQAIAHVPARALVTRGMGSGGLRG
jgi:hypothetical protein